MNMELMLFSKLINLKCFSDLSHFCPARMIHPSLGNLNYSVMTAVADRVSRLPASLDCNADTDQNDVYPKIFD